MIEEKREQFVNKMMDNIITPIVNSTKAWNDWLHQHTSRPCKMNL